MDMIRHPRKTEYWLPRPGNTCDWSRTLGGRVAGCGNTSLRGVRRSWRLRPSRSPPNL